MAWQRCGKFHISTNNMYIKKDMFNFIFFVVNDALACWPTRILTTLERWSIKLVVTISDIMYAICKVDKDMVRNCQQFGPILAAINTLTYKLAKLVPILKISAHLLLLRKLWNKILHFSRGTQMLINIGKYRCLFLMDSSTSLAPMAWPQWHSHRVTYRSDIG